MFQGLPWGVDSYVTWSRDAVFPWNSKVHHHAHKSPELTPTLNQCASFICKFHFNVIVPFSQLVLPAEILKPLSSYNNTFTIQCTFGAVVVLATPVMTLFIYKGLLFFKHSLNECMKWMHSCRANYSDIREFSLPSMLLSVHHITVSDLCKSVFYTYVM
jgi:hypothetical protein